MFYVSSKLRYGLLIRRGTEKSCKFFRDKLERSMACLPVYSLNFSSLFEGKNMTSQGEGRVHGLTYMTRISYESCSRSNNYLFHG